MKPVFYALEVFLLVWVHLSLQREVSLEISTKLLWNVFIVMEVVSPR